MVKWVLTLLLVLVILAIATPWLGRRFPRVFPLGRLPGDFRIALRGRMYYVPLASALVFSLLAWAVGRLL
jgi:hypothetical protein